MGDLRRPGQPGWGDIPKKLGHLAFRTELGAHSQQHGLLFKDKRLSGNKVTAWGRSLSGGGGEARGEEVESQDLKLSGRRGGEKEKGPALGGDGEEGLMSGSYLMNPCFV